MKAPLLARLEHRLRPRLTTLLSPEDAVRLYSASRDLFTRWLANERPAPVEVPEELSRTLWGIEFRSPLGNAAGMFKNGEGYEVCALQGAGFYLAGTTTANPRAGNIADIAIPKPFVPYPRSGAASNKLGLPNPGDAVVAGRLSMIERVSGCPIGASVGADDSIPPEARTSWLINGMNIYDRAGVDFLEMNESCPNTGHGLSQYDGLRERLAYVSEKFLNRRNRGLPVIVKFSNDTAPDQVPALMDMLFEFGYDGVNFGNTSIDYRGHAGSIDPQERALYDFFTASFGGGLSGRPLRESSEELAERAVEVLRAGPPSQEFHIVRTGGISHGTDLLRSRRAGPPLNQWFTGYFENFAIHGHGLYERMYAPLVGDPL